jgi:hypothetical protein
MELGEELVEPHCLVNTVGDGAVFGLVAGHGDGGLSFG